MPRIEYQELLPLRKECGAILEIICLQIGINLDDFFRHLAEKLGNDGASSYSRTYKNCVPQSCLLERYSQFAQAIDSAVKACSVDETIFNRRVIEDNWSRDREKFLTMLQEKNTEARQIILKLKFTTT